MIQDIIISFVNSLFAIMLVPQIIDVYKKKRTINGWTAGLTALGCFIIAGCFFSMNMMYSAITTTLTGISWVILYWM